MQAPRRTSRTNGVDFQRLIQRGSNENEIRLSIVLVDLDNFKTVNDTEGHQFGDHLLIRCADWLCMELHQTDSVCRYSGDEFGIILPETTRADARLMMTRLAGEFKEFGPREGAPASFGMSFGVASPRMMVQCSK